MTGTAQGVDHGAQHFGGRTDCVGLAAALHAQRVVRARGLAGMIHRKERHIVGARHRIIHIRAGHDHQPAGGADPHRLGQDRPDVHIDQPRAVIPRHPRAMQPCRHEMGGFLHDVAKAVRHLPAAGDRAHTVEISAGKGAQHAGHGGGPGRVDPAQAPMRHVRAQKMHIGLTMNVDVIGVFSQPGQKPDVLAPLGAGTDAVILWYVCSSLMGGATGVFTSAAPLRGVIVPRWRSRPDPRPP